MQNDETPAASSEFVDTLKVLAPYLILTVVAALVVVMLMFRFTPSLMTPPSVVTFDVLRYTSAQRAVASAFIGRNDEDVAQANELLTTLPQRARAVIAEVAGPDTLVVLKQAVVQGQTRDITDEVLKRLGLPLNVPVADSPAFVLDEVTPNVMIGVNPASRRPSQLTPATPNGGNALP